MSPNADCPASSPTMPGTTLPSTWPQIPAMARSPMVASSAIRMSQVEVPITFTSALLPAPAPPPPCGSQGAARYHHLAGEVQPLRPLRGQGADRQIGGPAVGKERVVEILSQQRIQGVEKIGGGRPPQLGCQRDLWPAEQRPRRMSAGAWVPLRMAGTQSHSSTQLQAAARTAASLRRRRIWPRTTRRSRPRRCSGCSRGTGRRGTAP